MLYVSQVNKVILGFSAMPAGVRESLGVVCGRKEAIVCDSLATLKTSVCLEGCREHSTSIAWLAPES